MSLNCLKFISRYGTCSVCRLSHSATASQSGVSGLDYFRKIISDVAEPEQSYKIFPTNHIHSEKIEQPDSSKYGNSNELKPKKHIEDIPMPRFDSDPLKALAKIGVVFTKAQKLRGGSDTFGKVTSEQVENTLRFLCEDLRLSRSRAAKIITGNPAVLTSTSEEQTMFLNYCESKGFSSDDILTMVHRAPRVLTCPVTFIDQQLGFLQEEFDLSSHEVRQCVVAKPKLITFPQQIVMARYMLKYICGFSDAQLKLIIVEHPRIFLCERPFFIETGDMKAIFKIIHQAGYSRDSIAQAPSVFRLNRSILRERLSYLNAFGLAQPDPSHPAHVNLRVLSSPETEGFCSLLKIPNREYLSFVREMRKK